MKTYLCNAKVLYKNKLVNGLTVVIENGLISEITAVFLSPEKDSEIIDASEMYLCPGMIDIDFHGAFGKDTMNAGSHALNVLSNYCAEHGVTSFYPTTWSASAADVINAINNVKNNCKVLSGAQVLGVHIEGPYINTKYRGAQLPEKIRNPDAIEYQKWFDTGMVN